MGLADKPLVASPSAVVFLIAMAFCLPETVIKKEEESNERLRYGGVAVAFLLLCFFHCLLLMSNGRQATYSVALVL